MHDDADRLAALLQDISADAERLNGKLVDAVRVLTGMGRWTAAIRLLVEVGGFQQAELAAALGVMRSTVARWFNGETQPPGEQVEVYANQLVRHVAAKRVSLDL